MKTPQMVLRKIGGIEFHQNHKSTMINATEFLDNLRTLQYIENEGDFKSPKNGYLDFSKRFRMLEWNRFERLPQTQAYLQALSRSERIHISELIISKRGRYGGTHVHPLVFIELCRWVSPDFSVAANRLVLDGLLEVRDLSGELYKEMCKALAEAYPMLVPRIFSSVATHLNKLVFGSDENNQRNITSESKLEVMNLLQEFIISTCEDSPPEYSELLNKISNRYLKTLERLERRSIKPNNTGNKYENKPNDVC